MVEMFDTAGAAQFLGISVPTLERLRLSGDGPPYAKLSPGPRGIVRYRREELDTWITSKMIKSTKEEGSKKKRVVAEDGGE